MTTEVNETAGMRETRTFYSRCDIIYATLCTLGEFSEKFDPELDLTKYDPEWYGYVTIENGHPLWEDADSFNDKYETTQLMDFAAAYTAMRQGFKVRRRYGMLSRAALTMAGNKIVIIEGDKAREYHHIGCDDIAAPDWQIIDNERVYVDYHELTVEPAPWQGDSRLDMSGKRNADDYVIYNKPH